MKVHWTGFLFCFTDFQTCILTPFYRFQKKVIRKSLMVLLHVIRHILYYFMIKTRYFVQLYLLKKKHCFFGEKKTAPTPSQVCFKDAFGLDHLEKIR